MERNDSLWNEEREAEAEAEAEEIESDIIYDKMLDQQDISTFNDDKEKELVYEYAKHSVSVITQPLLEHDVQEENTSPTETASDQESDGSLPNTPDLRDKSAEPKEWEIFTDPPSSKKNLQWLWPSVQEKEGEAGEEDEVNEEERKRENRASEWIWWLSQNKKTESTSTPVA
ncbi:hypothetical protein BDF14DRAFT_1833712 [Spinellus fusiger]|nr:hypothetical protein BDF14DRAFT_1833712 [Spinellus fusiger]